MHTLKLRTTLTALAVGAAVAFGGGGAQAATITWDCGPPHGRPRSQRTLHGGRNNELPLRGFTEFRSSHAARVGDQTAALMRRTPLTYTARGTAQWLWRARTRTRLGHRSGR